MSDRPKALCKETHLLTVALKRVDRLEKLLADLEVRVNKLYGQKPDALPAWDANGMPVELEIVGG